MMENPGATDSDENSRDSIEERTTENSPLLGLQVKARFRSGRTFESSRASAGAASTSTGSGPGGQPALRHLSHLQDMQKFQAAYAAETMAAALSNVMEFKENANAAFGREDADPAVSTDIANLVETAVEAVNKAAYGTERASEAAEKTAEAAARQEEAERQAKLAKLAHSATGDLLRVLKAAKQILLKATSTDFRTCSALVLSCASAADAIAAEAKRLADTAAGRQAEDLDDAAIMEKINSAKTDLAAKLETVWKESTINFAEKALGATKETFSLVQEAEYLKPLDPVVPIAQLRSVADQMLETALTAEAAVRLAADTANLFGLAADQGLFGDSKEAIKAAVSTLDQLMLASIITAKLANEAAIEAGNSDTEACANAVDRAKRSAEATIQVANLSVYAANAASSGDSNTRAETINAQEDAKNSVEKIKDLSNEEELTLKSWKMLAGFGLLLVMTALALVVEIRAEDMGSRNDTRLRNESDPSTKYRQVCSDCIGVQTIRCGFLLAASIALLWLEGILKFSTPVRVGLVGTVRIMKPSVSMLPPPLLILAFFVFSIPNWLSMVIEIICGVKEIGSMDCDGRDLTDHGIVIVVRRSLALFFSLLQTRFFLKYFNKSIQQRLGWSWLLLSVVLAVNIGVWFTTVGLELQDISGADQVIPKCTFCANSSINYFNDLLYPFQIEYCVMSSLLVGSMMANLGRFAVHLKSKSCSSEDIKIIRGKKNKDHDKLTHGMSNSKYEFPIAQKHSMSFLLGMIAILAAFLVIGFVRFDAHDEHSYKPELSMYFFLALVCMHALAMLPCIFLVHCLDRSSIETINFEHLIDRVLLLLGVIAILVNNIYSFWKNISGLPSTNEYNSTDFKLEIASNALGIFQCLLQTGVIELILIANFSYEKPRSFTSVFKRIKMWARHTWRLICECRKRRRDQEGEKRDQDELDEQDADRTSDASVYPAILNFLILLNAAEWLLSALCFFIFFRKSDDKKDWVTLLLMPLQVFYRFHSAVCIYEFKDILSVKNPDEKPNPEHQEAVTHSIDIEEAHHD